ncbi:MAG: hypothetical protein NDJ94_11040 [Vicinamibacteria bacterium]|nr:hypothetical protein [Vicinamibacteria bacterium]
MDAAPDGGQAEIEYYRTVEDYFVSRRGDPLFLSNPDWLMVHEWRRAGWPLRVVLRGIADAFEGHAHSWARARKVGSLAYCKLSVESAAERWKRALDAGEPDADEARGRLPVLVAALAAATAPEPAVQAALAAARRAVDAALAAAGSPLEDVERGLAEAESALVATIEQARPADAAAADSGVDQELAPYATRLPAKVLAQVRHDARVARLLALIGLPRLSVFH